MKIMKPLEAVGWLSSAGYQIVINESTRKAAQASKKKASAERQSGERLQKAKMQKKS